MALETNKKLNIRYYISNDYYVDATELDSNIPEVITNQISVDHAYVKILSLEGDKNKVTITVGIYTSFDKDRLIKTEIYSFKPSVTDNSDNFIKQGYEYLKTLDEYAEAIDVLEEGQML